MIIVLIRKFSLSLVTTVDLRTTRASIHGWFAKMGKVVCMEIMLISVFDCPSPMTCDIVKGRGTHTTLDLGTHGGQNK